MTDSVLSAKELEQSDVELDRETFLLEMVRHLSGTLQDIVGLNEAEGFISLVGGDIGDEINQRYEHRFREQLRELDLESTANILIDLKRRIGGQFRVVQVSAESLVLENTRCPFGDAVLDRPSLCMMTSNVFGRIVADKQGYARVEIEKAIANHDGFCRIRVNLRPQTNKAPVSAREYFGRSEHE